MILFFFFYRFFYNVCFEGFIVIFLSSGSFSKHVISFPSSQELLMLQRRFFQPYVLPDLPECSTRGVEDNFQLILWRHRQPGITKSISLD